MGCAGHRAVQAQVKSRLLGAGHGGMVGSTLGHGVSILKLVETPGSFPLTKLTTVSPVVSRDWKEKVLIKLLKVGEMVRASG